MSRELAAATRSFLATRVLTPATRSREPQSVVRLATTMDAAEEHMATLEDLIIMRAL